MKKLSQTLLFMQLLLVYGEAKTANFVLNTSGISYIYWPFTNSVYVNDTTGTNGWVVTCGFGCGKHQNGDYYADDWAQTDGTALGEDFLAPISGTVVLSDWISSGSACNSSSVCAYGNQVVIRSADNKSFAFRVTHLDTRTVSNGQFVAAGTKIGTVGKTSCCPMNPHAHCVLYRNITDDIVNNNLSKGATPPGIYYAAPYYFNAVASTPTPQTCENVLWKTVNLTSGDHHYYASYGIILYNSLITSTATVTLHAKKFAIVNTTLRSKVKTLIDPCTATAKTNLNNIEVSEDSIINNEDLASQNEDPVISQNQFEVYPNPFKDELTFSGNYYSSDAPIYLNISNVYGQVVMQKRIDDIHKDKPVFTISTKNISAGIYVCTLSCQGEVLIRKKIIKIGGNKL